jgi:hypothetical protein
VKSHRLVEVVVLQPVEDGRERLLLDDVDLGRHLDDGGLDEVGSDVRSRDAAVAIRTGAVGVPVAGSIKNKNS